ncbi:hypothetical protein Rhe02_61460 [Rhizocola hellebori]|uniref:Uncharacterized protein n=1 Tax=Rhizocola hellebori TaxID=1392758 RepID=A0A8J3VI45_9ACTN|nr:hypothetical protein [Rhizocola hellebori]GIH08079.1 hypothetical protein Rhe02_61460 [Rhizocola hellebori]
MDLNDDSPDWARTQRYQGLSPIWRSVAIVIGTGLVVFLASVTSIWLLLGRPSIATQRLDTDALLEVARIALIITGGIGGIVALVVAYRKQRITERADARQELSAREANYQLFTEVFNSTSLLLGNASPAVRLAGVYAMAELADGWPRFRRLCVDVLCAYVRLPMVDDHDRDAEETVRHTLLTILEERIESNAWSDAKPHLDGIEWGDMSASGTMRLRKLVRDTVSQHENDSR